jgi:membrane-associated phospholipid phosphatase
VPAVGDRGTQNLTDTHRWVVRVWVLVALFTVATVIRSHYVGIPVRDPGGAYFRNRLAWSVILFAVLTLVDAALRTDRNSWTLTSALATLRSRWHSKRTFLAFSGLLAYYVVYLDYHNLKSWNACNPQHDNKLLRIDSWLFFGHSPAMLLHSLFGQHLAAHVFAVIYESFSVLVPVVVVAMLVFADTTRKSYAFLLSSMWVWILGTIAYYLVPATGPFYSAPQDFANLSQTMVTAKQAHFVAQRADLLHDPAAHGAFSQISAFASLHTGFTCMVVLMMRYYGFRRTSQALTVYLAAVMAATIYLGWHFVVDDVAGIGVAYLAVLFARLMIYPPRGRWTGRFRHSRTESRRRPTGATQPRSAATGAEF